MKYLQVFLNVKELLPLLQLNILDVAQISTTISEVFLSKIIEVWHYFHVFLSFEMNVFNRKMF